MLSLNIEFVKVDYQSIAEWIHLAPVLLRDHLISQAKEASESESSLKAWGIKIKTRARGQSANVALLLGELDEDLNKDGELLELLSIYSIIVTKKLRRYGLAKSLIANVILWAKDCGLDGVRLPVPLSSQNIDALKALSPSREGWISSTGQVVGDFSDSEAAKVLLERLERSSSYQKRNASWEISEFPKLPNKLLKDRIRVSLENGWQTPWNPDGGDHRWTPCAEYSRLAWDKGEIIGWLITSLVNHNSLHYAKLWVDPGWEKSGAAFAMLSQVVRSAHFANNGKRIKKARFISFNDNYRHHKWMQQKVKPICDKWSEIDNRDFLF